MGIYEPGKVAGTLLSGIGVGLLENGYVRNGDWREGPNLAPSFGEDGHPS